MTTVEELIEALQQCNPKAKVLVSRDGEGNSFHALDGIGVSYIEKGTDQYEYDVLSEEDITEEYLVEEHDEVLANFEQVVVVWPT